MEIIGFVIFILALIVMGVFFLVSSIIQSIITARAYRASVIKCFLWAIAAHLLAFFSCLISLSLLSSVIDTDFFLWRWYGYLAIILEWWAFKVFFDWLIMRFVFEKAGKRSQKQGLPHYLVVQCIPVILTVLGILGLIFYLVFTFIK